MIKLAYLIIVCFVYSAYGNENGKASSTTAVPASDISGSLSGASTTVRLDSVPPKSAVHCRRGHYAVAIPFDMYWQDEHLKTYHRTVMLCPLCLLNAMQTLAVDSDSAVRKR